MFAQRYPAETLYCTSDIVHGERRHSLHASSTTAGATPAAADSSGGSSSSSGGSSSSNSASSRSAASHYGSFGHLSQCRHSQQQLQRRPPPVEHPHHHHRSALSVAFTSDNSHHRLHSHQHRHPQHHHLHRHLHSHLLPPAPERVSSAVFDYNGSDVGEDHIGRNDDHDADDCEHDDVHCVNGVTDDVTSAAANRLSDLDVEQVEHCYRSQKTAVYVARCLANLYCTRADPHGNPAAWQLSSCGVPVLIFDKGETRARTVRQLQIVLAERGTGFALWRDKIDNLSQYTCPGQEAAFQTMYLSYDHREMVGLSFDSEEAAQDFYETVSDLCSDPKNISLSMPKLSKKKAKGGKKPSKRTSDRRRLDKSEISSPICFQHVTSVDAMDREKLNTLSSLVQTLSLEVNSVESSSSSAASCSNSITSSHL